MEIIDEKYNDVDVMHVHSGKIKGVFSSTNPLEIQGFVRVVKVVRLYLQLIIHYIELKKVVSMLILFTLMKHIIQFKETFSLLLTTSLSMLTDATSLQQHQSIVVL